MWLLGHTALAYLVAMGLLAIPAADSSKYLKNERTVFVLLIFIFANWPDFTHVGVFRVFSHNLLTVLIVTTILIVAVMAYKRISLFEASVLFAASISHLIADCIFSSFYLYYPFNATVQAVFPFNGQEDIIAEIVIAIPFLILFAHSEAIWRSGLTSREVPFLHGKVNAVTDFFSGGTAFSWVFGTFLLFTVSQFIIYIWLSYAFLLNLNAIYISFLILQLVFIMMVTRFLSSSFRSRKPGGS